MDVAALEFTIGNDPSELQRMRSPVAAFLAGAGASRHAVLTVEVTLEEIVGNIVKYGHGGTGHGTIHVVLSSQDDEVHLLFEDDGDPFDPTRYAGPRPPLTLHEGRAGGVGLRLVRAMASSLSYRHIEGTNRLEVRVPLHQPGPGFAPPQRSHRQPTA